MTPTADATAAGSATVRAACSPAGCARSAPSWSFGVAGGGDTVIVAPSETAPTDAVIRAAPGATAVTRPVPFTVANDGSRLAHVNVTPGIEPLNGLNASAESCTVWPGAVSVATCGVTATRATCVDGTAVAFTSAVAYPVAETAIICVPSGAPRVQVTLACPAASVVAVAAESRPPPDCTAKPTATPGTGAPVPPITRTTIGDASAAPCWPVCASPETTSTRGATAFTVTGTPSESAPYAARTMVLPPPTAVTSPVASTVAIAGSSEV